MYRYVSFIVLCSCWMVVAKAQMDVPTSAPANAAQRSYHDGRYGVSFRIPPGWAFNRKDRQVSTFRLDARSAVQHSQMRAVANLDFNPFPMSTLSGALFYYSVERHSTDRECEQQAGGLASRHGALESRSEGQRAKDVQDIGGMDFVHGHDEHGGFCVEARDDVYTAFHRGSCYRFDLEVNTFCSVTSGAQEMTEAQMTDIEGRMAGILSTVTFRWEKGGAHSVPSGVAGGF